MKIVFEYVSFTNGLIILIFSIFGIIRNISLDLVMNEIIVLCILFSMMVSISIFLIISSIKNLKRLKEIKS